MLRQELKMSNNDFTGQIPESIGTLEFLTGMMRRRFIISIMLSFSSVNVAWPYTFNWIELRLENNAFSGTIPDSFRGSEFLQSKFTRIMNSAACSRVSFNKYADYFSSTTLECNVKY